MRTAVGQTGKSHLNKKRARHLLQLENTTRHLHNEQDKIIFIKKYRELVKFYFYIVKLMIIL